MQVDRFPSVRKSWSAVYLMSSASLLGMVVATMASETRYAAFVAEDSTDVRSGPGSQFYQTSALTWGSRVEVYRHDEDFAAIRPPEGSFSWVPADAVEIGADQLTARVVVPNIKTRIGSITTERSDAEYVTLDEGERLQVLGFQTFSATEWVKIAPPAGEFRWVRLDHLQKTPPVRVVPPEPTPSDETDLSPQLEEVSVEVVDDGEQDDPQPISSEDEPVEESLVTIQAAVEEQADESAAMGESTATGDAEVTTDGDFPPATANAPTEADDQQTTLAQWSYDLSPKQQAPPPEQSAAVAAESLDAYRIATALPDASAAIDEVLNDPVPPPASDTTPLGFSEVGRYSGERRIQPTSPEYLSLQLDQLEVAVSQEVCKPTAQWQLGGIHGSCMAVIDAAADADIRSRAQALLAKVAQFEDVRRRGLRLNPAAEFPADPGIATAGPLTPKSPSPLYDGSGWLMPVLTNRKDVPRYVLTDDQGQVLQFVSPQPGLNLNTYERKKVGIFGRRGYLPSMSQPHLMAERIVSLDKVR